MRIHPEFGTILDLIKEINSTTISLGKKDGVFSVSAFPFPYYSCYEAGFLKYVSWTYTLFFESGRGNIDYLLKRFPLFDLDFQKAKNYLNLTHCLRTNFQHSLDQNEKRNQDLKLLAENWFHYNCGKVSPISTNEWNKCLNVFVIETISFLKSTLNCICGIKEDEFRSQMVQDWISRMSRFHHTNEWDVLIYSVANEFGISHIDPVKIRHKYYEIWSKELESLTGDYCFEFEARKRIQVVLTRNPLPPVTAQDLMAEFNLTQGPQVGEMFRKAQKIYMENPCDHETLLKNLHKEIDSVN